LILGLWPPQLWQNPFLWLNNLRAPY
jgi:hypothetical protein